MDIDMVVTGSLEDFLGYDGAFATGSHFNKPNEINSTLMSIPGRLWSAIWTTFLRFRSRVMRSFRLGFRNLSKPSTDQDKAMAGHVSGTIGELQEACQRWAASRGARVVSFHGKPDPEDVDDEFVKRCWI